MAKTIYIGNEMKVLFDEWDFVEVVRENMGNEAAKVVEELIEERDEARRDLAVANEDVDYYIGVALEAEEKAWKYDQLCK